MSVSVWQPACAPKPQGSGCTGTVLGRPPEGVVGVRALYLPIAIAPLRHVPTVVEGVKGSGVGGGRAPREQARRTERVDGKEAACPVVLAHRVGAIIEEVGASAPRLLPRLKAVPIIAVCLDHTIGHQTVFRAESKRLTNKALSFWSEIRYGTSSPYFCHTPKAFSRIFPSPTQHRKTLEQFWLRMSATFSTPASPVRSPRSWPRRRPGASRRGGLSSPSARP